MAERILKIWYIKEWDTLDVGWDDKDGYYIGTDNDLILAEVDMEGNFQGLQIEGVTHLGDNLLKVRTPPLEKTKEEVKPPQKVRPRSSQGINMAEIVLKIWYIKEADLLQVSWSDNPSYYAPTENEWVFADVDMKGNFQGFEIEGVTHLEDGVLKIRIPSPFKNKEPERSRPD